MKKIFVGLCTLIFLFIALVLGSLMFQDSAEERIQRELLTLAGRGDTAGVEKLLHPDVVSRMDRTAFEAVVSTISSTLGEFRGFDSRKVNTDVKTRANTLLITIQGEADFEKGKAVFKVAAMGEKVVIFHVGDLELFEKICRVPALQSQIDAMGKSFVESCFTAKYQEAHDLVSADMKLRIPRNQFERLVALDVKQITDGVPVDSVESLGMSDAESDQFAGSVLMKYRIHFGEKSDTIDVRIVLDSMRPAISGFELFDRD